MSVRVAKLESLLSRVQERASQPRPVALAVAPVVEEVELDEPDDLGAPVAEAQDLELDEPELSLPEPSAPEPSSPEAAAPESMALDDIGEMEEIEEVDLDEEPVSGGMDAAMSAPASAPPIAPVSAADVGTPPVAQEVPTMEQLGETISLEEGKAQDFELDEPVLEEPEPAAEASGHLEMEIPGSVPPVAGESLQVPESAREDLERVRLGEATPVEARVSTRPVVSTNVVDFVSSAKEFQPESFAALLDASLGLK